MFSHVREKCVFAMESEPPSCSIAIQFDLGFFEFRKGDARGSVDLASRSSTHLWCVCVGGGGWDIAVGTVGIKANTLLD